VNGRSGAVESDEVPRALRCWFVVHGVVDWIVAVPLFLIPDAFLLALGWTVVDPMAARGVAAALVGIGTQSLLARNSTGAVYRELLSLKILWSFTATLGFAWTALSVGPRIGWLFVAIFAFFNVLWMYWRRRLGTGT
jgi:hypothetical protein